MTNQTKYQARYDARKKAAGEVLVKTYVPADCRDALLAVAAKMRADAKKFDTRT